MKNRLHGLPSVIAAIGLAATASAAAAAPADTGAPAAHLISGVYSSADPVRLEQAQWAWQGRQYCWYPDGWRGPGYYWCGYAYRRGFGWGGPSGWNGWRYDRGWHRGWDRRRWRDDRWRGDRYRDDRYRDDRWRDQGDYPR
jgi:hypothetical protein